MTFRALYFSENIRYSWEERYNSFREKAADNEMKVKKILQRDTAENFDSLEKSQSADCKSDESESRKFKIS